MKANNGQVGGQHYQAKLQHWDYAVRVLDNRYLEGNITKYVLRHRKKNGLQDLQKARHYLLKLEEEYLAGRIKPHTRTDMTFDINRFVQDNGLVAEEARVMRQMAHWTSINHLQSVSSDIAVLIRNAEERQRTLEAIKAGARPPSIADVLRAEEEDKDAQPGAGYSNQDR